MLRPQIPWKMITACCLLACGVSAAHAQDASGIHWRTDYNKARKEAEAKNLPMIIDFITTPCQYCEKMDHYTFPDPRVASTINQRFVALKINGLEEDKRELASKLQIDRFPTIVLASADGKILEIKVGFQPADALHELMQNTLAKLTPPDALQEKYQIAAKLEADGNYVRAISSLRDIVDAGGGRPIQKNAQDLLKKIDKEGFDRLARAKELQEKGKGAEALEAYSDVLRQFNGLPASRAAQELITQLVRSNAALPVVQREKRAAELMRQAQEFYKAKDYGPCLYRCHMILTNYGDLPEGQQAYVLRSEINNNREWLQSTADVMVDHLGSIWLSLADSHLKHGEVPRAQYYLNRVVATFPGTHLAESAQIRLNQLQGTVPVHGTGLAGQ